ncbi:acid phosphatase/vanadium-dependent haloperoxidase protein-related protein [Tanacetum coccineum]
MTGIADDDAILDRIETLVYASQRHLQHLENGSRAGFFLEMELMYKEHRWDLDQLIGSGGMPHFATVTALAVAVGLHDGLGSSTFAIALILACTV